MNGYIFILPFILGLSGFWYVLGPQEKQFEKLRSERKVVVDSILRITILIQEKDGRLVNRTLLGDDAKNWYWRWVFQKRDIDYNKFKWEFKEIK